MENQHISNSNFIGLLACVIALFAFPAIAQTNKANAPNTPDVLNTANIEESKFITDLRNAADSGSLEAMYNLGNTFYVGVGAPKNYSEAIKWFTRAAEQGYPKAESSLGTMYYNGLGVPKNIATAIKWWSKAADHHDANAQDQLGFAYLLGDGVQQDDVEAYMWFSIAAINKDAHAIQDRDKVSKYMVPGAIIEAQRLQKEWTQSHP